MGLSDRAVLFLSAALAVLAGCGDPAGPPVVPIEAPSGLAATELPSGDIAVSWQDNSDTETGFEVGRSTTGAGGTYATLASPAADVSTYQDSQVDGVTQYCYRVRAVGAAGTTPSAFTMPACHQATAPTAPSGLAATAGFGQVDLSWSDNSDDEAAFEVWSSTGGAGGSFTLEASVAAGVTSYNSVGRADGTQYCYQVRALGAKGQPSEFSNTACATTLVPTSPPPVTPTDLTAVVSGSTAIALAWTDKASDEVGFELWRSTTGPAGVYTPIDTVGANVTDASDVGLGAGAQYCYQVRALGGGTAPPSGFSNDACATTPAPPAAPSGLAATPTASTAVGLGWTDNSSDEQGFEIWRSTTANGTYAIIDTVAADATGATDAGLTPSTQFCYRVRALGAGVASPSPLSNSDCATTPAAPPATPSALAAVAATPSRINVTWQDDATDEAGFEVWRSSTGLSGTYTLRSARPVNSVAYNDTGLSSATTYCYQVKATGAGSAPNSPFTGPVCATTPLVVRIVLFGDSNTDRCEDHVAGSDPLRFGSYVSVKPALTPTAQHLSCSVAAKVVVSWNGLRAESVLVVNHAIASTTTGGLGGAGDPFRSGQTAPNARTSVGGITRFEAEVLGQGAPTWSGGETNLTWFPSGAVTRVNAYVPKANDFAYVSMGTNDDAGATRFLSAQATADNLRWMIQGWLDAGHRADHFILTTLAPRDDANTPTSIPSRNVLIQALATELGVHLIDLAGHVSDDNGATWRDPSLNIGDGIHYTETVRGWLGDQVAAWMSAEAPPLP